MDIIRKNLKIINIDDFLVKLSELYIILPIIIFMFGWLKLWIALLGTAIFCLFFYKMNASIEKRDDLINKNNIKYWILVLVIAGIWVYLSGIGSFVFQNDDYWVRNPIFRDLSTYQWPVMYDLSKESHVVQQICGSSQVAFSYYFCWWLPVAWISKIFCLGEIARNILLYLWAVLAVFLIIYLLCRKVKKCSLIVPIVLVFFSGLDIIPYCVLNRTIPLIDHLERWATFFQYSSNTTQLFWVFNQSLPVWIMVALLLQFKDNKYIAGLSSLAFAYSPWATMGMVPIAIAGSFKDRKTIKDIFNYTNILIPFIMLVVFGSFYMSSTGSNGFFGTVFGLYPESKRMIVYMYITFVIIEFGIYFLIIHSDRKKYDYYWITLIELILFPLFVVRDFNFTMRGTIPALFLLMYFVIKYLIDNKGMKLKKLMLILFLIIGSYTPITEINRTIKNTIGSSDYLQEEVGSFGDIQTIDESRILIAKDQFFIYNYKNSFFFKYLSK